MKKSLFYFLLIFIINPSAVKASELEPSFGCYYQMDDKYSNEQDKTKIEQWQQNKLGDLSQKGILENIFSYKGGGPHGAAWNSTANLFCVAQIQWKASEIKNTTIQLNEKETKLEKGFFNSASNNKTTFVYFTVSSSIWEKSLKPLTKTDFYKRYSPDVVEKHEKNPSGMPLDVGDIVEIAIEINGNDDKQVFLSGIFHRVLGE